MWYMYEVFEHLLRLWVGTWLHIHTVTTTDTSPELWELAEILPDASVQTMPIHFGWGCRTFQTAFHVHVTYLRCLSTFPGCGWVCGFTLTQLPPQTLFQIWENWLQFYLMQVCKPCHYALVEGVEPFKLHFMSMSYIYERFECLIRLWMGVRLHIHINTSTEAFPELWELAEIWPDASVQTMPLCFEWGCKAFQTASHIHVIHIWGVWAPSRDVDGHMVLQSHCYRHRCFPRFVKVGWSPTWFNCANHATSLWLRLWNLSICIPCPYHTYMRCLQTFSGCGWAYGFTFTSIPPQTLPQICESWLKSYLMQVYKPCHYILVEAVEPFKLHLMSMAYLYEVFEHLLRMLMGIWLHSYTVTTTGTSLDLGKLAEILPDASVQTMPLCFGWGCRTFQTVFHAHVIHDGYVPGKSPYLAKVLVFWS